MQIGLFANEMIRRSSSGEVEEEEEDRDPAGDGAREHFGPAGHSNFSAARINLIDSKSPKWFHFIIVERLHSTRRWDTNEGRKHEL